MSVACLGTAETQLYGAGTSQNTNTPTWDPGAGAYFDGSYNTGTDAVVCRFANLTTTKVAGSPAQDRLGGLEVIPNPSNGLYNALITYDNYSGPDDLQVMVTDITGKQVLRQHFSLNGTHTAYKVDIRNQPAGIYLLRVSGGGGVQTAKLIKY